MITISCWSDREYTFAKAKTALLVIDMQRDFFGPEGGNLLPILPRASQVLVAARAAKLNIVHTREGYLPDGSDINPYKRHLGYVGRDGPGGPFLVRGSHGHDFMDGFQPRPGEPIFDKAGFSGFYGTELHSYLQSQAITHLIIMGVTTQCCVHSTLRDAVERGYFCLTVADCCAAEEQAVHEATLTIVQAVNHLFGWLADSDRLLAKIGEC